MRSRLNTSRSNTSRLVTAVGSLLRRWLNSPSPEREPRSRQPRERKRDRPEGDRPGGGSGLKVEYTPCIDGDPDPGEVVWTWVPYEDDPTQGKDRPVVIIGRHGSRLAGVALTSKQHDNEPQVNVGAGPWDREGRPSYAKVERLLDIDPDEVRREGAVLPRKAFDAVVAGVQRYAGR